MIEMHSDNPLPTMALHQAQGRATSAENRNTTVPSSAEVLPLLWRLIPEVMGFLLCRATESMFYRAPGTCSALPATSTFQSHAGIQGKAPISIRSGGVCTERRERGRQLISGSEF